LLHVVETIVDFMECAALPNFSHLAVHIPIPSHAVPDYLSLSHTNASHHCVQNGSPLTQKSSPFSSQVADFIELRLTLFVGSVVVSVLIDKPNKRAPTEG
jgi:hypothetical protein